MYIVRSSTIGSGVTHGSLGIVLGTGATGPDGGTHTLVGHTIGIGGIATHGIVTTTAAHSTTHRLPARAIATYTAV